MPVGVSSLTARAAEVSGLWGCHSCWITWCSKGQGPSHPTDPCLQTIEALPDRHVLQGTL